MAKQGGVVDVHANINVNNQNVLAQMKNTAKTIGHGVKGIQNSFHGLNKTIGITQGVLSSIATGTAFVGFKRLSAVAEEFEFGLVGVGKTTDIVGEQLHRLGKEIQGLSLEIPVATTQMLNIAEVAGQLGVKGEKDILAFTSAISKLRLATDLTSESFAAASLARILTVTDTELDKVENFASVITKLGNNYAATESEITNVATRVAQTTAQFNTSAADVAAISTVLRAAGERAEAGGSAIGIFFRKMNRAIRIGGKEFQKIQKITGKSQEELLRTLEKNSTDAFVEILRGLKRLDAVGIENFFDDLKINTNEVNRVISPLIKNLDDLEEALEMSRVEFMNPTELNRETDQFSNTFYAKMVLLRNSLNKLFQGLGQSLNKELIPMIDKFAKFIDSKSDDIISFFDKYKTVIAGIAAIPLGATIASGFLLIKSAIAPVIGSLGHIASFAVKLTPVGRALSLIATGLSIVLTDTIFKNADVVGEFKKSWIDGIEEVIQAFQEFSTQFKQGYDIAFTASGLEWILEKVKEIDKILSKAGDGQEESFIVQYWKNLYEDVEQARIAYILMNDEQLRQQAIAQALNGQQEKLRENYKEFSKLVQGVSFEQYVNMVKTAMNENEKLELTNEGLNAAFEIFIEEQKKAGKSTKDLTEQVSELNEELTLAERLANKLKNPLKGIELDAIRKGIGMYSRTDIASKLAPVGGRTEPIEIEIDEEQIKEANENLEDMLEKLVKVKNEAEFNLKVASGYFGDLDESILKTVYNLGLIDEDGKISAVAKNLIDTLSQTKRIEDANESLERYKEALSDITSEMEVATGVKSELDVKVERLADSIFGIAKNTPDAIAKIQELKRLLLETDIAKTEEDMMKDSVLKLDEDAIKRATTLIESVRTPQEEYNAKIAELNELFASGMIPNQEIYNRLLEKYNEELAEANAGPLQEFAESIENSFERVSDSMVDALVKGEDAMETFKNAFAAFAIDIVKEAIKLFVVQQILGAITGMLGGVGSGGGGGGMGTGSLAGRSGSTASYFAKGGIVTDTAMFTNRSGKTGVMGEAGPEAIMPLKTVGGKLGVSAEGLQNQGPQTIIIDARGSNGDVAVQEAVMRGIAAAAPSIIHKATVKSTSNILDLNRRQPQVFGRG